MSDIADKLALSVEKGESRQLAFLLGTDHLESRALDLIFLPRRSKGKQVNNPAPWTSSRISRYYLERTSGRLLILGDAGTGKTVLATKLCVELARQRKDLLKQGPSGVVQVPVVFALSTWRADLEFEEWIQEQLAFRYRLSRRLAASLVANGWILPILDGLDEMDGGEGAPRRSEAAAQRLSDYIAMSSSHRLVITSRAGSRYYNRLSKRVRNIDVVEMRPVSVTQAQEYIQSHIEIGDAHGRWDPFFESMYDSRSLVRRTLSQPWHLTMAVAHVSSGGDVEDLLPTQEERNGQRKHGLSLYKARIAALVCGTYITTRCKLYAKNRKEALRREIHLRAIAKMLVDSSGGGEKDTSNTDLALHDLWKRIGTKRLRFTRVAISYTAMHLGFALLSLLPGGVGDGGGDNRGSVLVLLQFAANFLMLALITARLVAAIREPLTLKLSRALSARGLTYSFIGTSGGITVGWLAAESVSLAFGLGTGLIVALPFLILATHTPYDAIVSTEPTELINRDLRVGFLLAFGLGFSAGTYYTDIFDSPSIGVAFGVSYWAVTL
jgi:hypothetical protein